MATDWVEMVHDVIGGKGLVPNKENVIAARRAKGWRLASEPPAAEKPAGRKSRKEKPVVTNGGDDTSEEQDRG